MNIPTTLSENEMSAAPPPDAPAAQQYAYIIDQLDQLARRSIRTETRLVRLLAAHNLTPDGFPIEPVTMEHSA